MHTGSFSVGTCFTGAIYPHKRYITRVIPTEGVSFELVDNSYLLEGGLPCFCISRSFGETWYVFNNLDKDHSVVHQLLYSLGFVDALIDSSKKYLEGNRQCNH